MHRAFDNEPGTYYFGIATKVRLTESEPVIVGGDLRAGYARTYTTIRLISALQFFRPGHHELIIFRVR